MGFRGGGAGGGYNKLTSSSTKAPHHLAQARLPTVLLLRTSIAHKQESKKDKKYELNMYRKPDPETAAPQLHPTDDLLSVAVNQEQKAPARALWVWLPS